MIDAKLIETTLQTCQDHPPVPAEPLHLCTNCNYILSGLKSRRCPECGRPFTLASATEYLKPKPTWIEVATSTLLPEWKWFVSVPLILGGCLYYYFEAADNNTLLRVLGMWIMTGSFFTGLCAKVHLDLEWSDFSLISSVGVAGLSILAWLAF